MPSGVSIDGSGVLPSNRSAAEILPKAASVLEHEIQNRSLLLLAQFERLLPLAGRAGAKKTFEDQPRVRLRGDRRSRRLPRKVVLICTRIARIAIPGLANGI